MVLIDERPYDTIVESDDTPGAGCLAIVERPYDRSVESDETPGAGC